MQWVVHMNVRKTSLVHKFKQRSGRASLLRCLLYAPQADDAKHAALVRDRPGAKFTGFRLFQSFLDVEHMEKLTRRLFGRARMQLTVGLWSPKSWDAQFPRLEY